LQIKHYKAKLSLGALLFLDTGLDLEPLCIPCRASQTALNLAPLTVALWKGRVLSYTAWAGAVTRKMLQIGVRRGAVEGPGELPGVQSWEEGFLQGVGELFPSALNSLLMNCPLQGVGRLTSHG